jgi:membrane-associated phospholipid phosphatase
VSQSRTIVATAVASAFRKPRRDSATGPFWPNLAVTATAALAFIALFLAAKLLLDVWSITEARHLPRWVVDLSGKVSAFGKAGYVLWPLAGLLVLGLLCGWRATTRPDRLVFATLSLRLGFLFSAVALPGLLTSILKPLIGRARPYLTGQPDAFFYAPFAYFRELFHGTMPFPEYAYGSMPSGHATTAVAIAVAFSAMWPRLWPAFWTFALVICLTRLTIAVHHPTDVMVGAAIGGLGALAIRNYFAARRWVFAVDAAGQIHAMPGPGWRRVMRSVARLWSRS